MSAVHHKQPGDPTRKKLKLPLAILVLGILVIVLLPTRNCRWRAASTTNVPRDVPLLESVELDGHQVLDEHGYDLIRIEPGEFWMGSPDDENDRLESEGPRHRVTMARPYYIGATEVTQGLYEAMMVDDPSDCRYGCSKDHPVQNVSWLDAATFCNRLSRLEGRTGAYRIEVDLVTSNQSADSYRLPTEAEWEYAARAGGTHIYAGSDNLDSVGWYARSPVGGPQPVAQKQPNAWGLYDMSGNVWEWVEDEWHDNYEGAPADSRAWVDTPGAMRVIRGGSFPWVASGCRAARRDRNEPASRGISRGFRIVLPAPAAN